MGVPCGFPPRGFARIKSSLHFKYSRCRLLFLGSQQIRPLSRGRGLGRGLLRAARISVLNGGGFCPLARGGEVGVRLPAEGCLHLNMMGGAGCFFGAAAAPSVGMAAQRHRNRANAEIYRIEKTNEKAACTSFSNVQAAFLRTIRLCRHRHHLQRIRAAAFTHVRAAGDDVLVAHF